MIKAKNSKILFTATSLDFLLNYKVGISKNFHKDGNHVTWNVPVENIDSTSKEKIPKEIGANLWLSPRKGIFVFIKMIFSYSKFIINNNSKITLISHTVYSNLASIIACYLFNKKNLKLVIFVSGFGPARIRNSLRIRLLGRIYLLFLRLISNKKNILVVTLNFKDKNLVQDFSSSRRVMIMKEAGITEDDLKLGNISFIKRKANIEKKVLSVGFFGRFLLEKGIDDFKYIVQASKEHNFNFDFLIGGTTDKYNSSSVSASKLFIDFENVKVFDNPKYTDFFSKIDILIFPSYREGHPFYLLRSMAFGVVPLIYPNPGLSTDILDDYNGLVSKYTHPKSIFTNLIRLNKNRKYLLEISENARNYSTLEYQSQTFRDKKISETISNFINN